MLTKFFLIVLIIVAGCDESPTDPDILIPSPLTVDVISTQLGTVKILDISLDGSASVRVDYWYDSTSVLRQISSAEDNLHSVVLAQMVQNTTYQYEVTPYLESNDGTPMSGSLTTDSLHANINNLIDITVTGESTVPMMILEPRWPPWAGFLIVTTQGEAVWQYQVKWTPQGMTLRENGNFVFLDTDLGEGLIEVDATGEVINRLLLSDHTVVAVH